MHHLPSVNVGDKVKKGDVLADNYSSDGGRMALGQNVLVAFLSWKGANFEDAIILSERMVKEDKFTSVHLEEFSINIRDTKLGRKSPLTIYPMSAKKNLRIWTKTALSESAPRSVRTIFWSEKFLLKGKWS